MEKIVYIADYIEPKRDKAPNLAIVRKLAFQDLDECMYKILGDTLAYLEENPKDIDNATKDAFLYYKGFTHEKTVLSINCLDWQSFTYRGQHNRENRLRI